MFSRAMGRQVLPVWPIPVLLVAGCGHAGGPATPPEYVLGPPAILVPEESGTLASPTGIALDSAGTLYVLDRMDKRIVRVAPDGSITGRIGRSGQGPGELTDPLAFGVDAGDSVRVFDFGTGAIQVFSTGGTYVRQYRADIRGIPSRIGFGPDGRVAYSGTHPTSEGALVAELDRSGAQTGLLDSLVRAETAIPEDLIDQVHQRRLPDFMRNSALPVLTADGGAWLFLQTEAVLDHLTAAGTRDVREKVNVPEMTAIADAYFKWYARVHVPDMLRYFAYLEDAAVTDGSVWLLWQVPADQPGLITLHDNRGRLCARLLLRGVGEDAQDPDGTMRSPRRRLAVDARRSRIYVLDQNTAQVWAFATPVTSAATLTCGSG
jgi:6-bladed beta-propeller